MINKSTLLIFVLILEKNMINVQIIIRIKKDFIQCIKWNEWYDIVFKVFIPK